MSGYSSLPPGARIGERYVIEATIGKGRSSTVYRALDQATRSPVALKVLDPFLAQDPIAMERFRQEAAIIRRLNHPDIISVHDLAREGGFQVIAMELFEGEDLKSALARTGPFPLDRFLPVAARIASAIHACHAQRILHRDIKPQNVLWNEERGEVRLVDFGISKVNAMSDLTKTGTILGTPEYLAPELFQSSRPDTRSDIYSLGVLFYELLAGKPPYHGVTLASIMTQAIRGQFTDLRQLRPEVPEWLNAIINKCLRTDPGARFQSCYELVSDLAKGERAVSRIEERRSVAHCMNCKGRLVAGLLFCHGCGKFTDEVIEPGGHSIVLSRFDEAQGLMDFFVRNYPATSPQAIRSRLRRLPCLVLHRISERSAMAVANELSAYPCEFQISHRLPSEFKLPRWYLGLALLPLALLAAFVPFSGGAVPLLGSALGAALVYALYRARIRPVIRQGARRQGSAPELEHMAAAARALADRRDLNLKTIAANILARYYRIRAKARLLPHFSGLEATDRAVAACLNLLETLERHQAFLERTSLNAIRDRLAAVATKLGRATSTEESEKLIALKIELERSFRDYQEAQERYSSAYLAILNVNAGMQKIEDHLDRATPSSDAEAELAALADDLGREELASPEAA